MFVPLSSFMPDGDPFAPGIITDCTNLHPTLRGYEGAPAAVNSGVDTLAAACRGAFFTRKRDNTLRQFAGSATKLYELSTTTWTDRTRAVGGDYTLGGEDRWSFSQFGDVTLAANGQDQLQSSSAGAFANLTGAPTPKFVAVSNGFVMTGQLENDGTYAHADGLWWCADHDHTDWTPSTTTKAGQYRVLEVAGPITALHPLGQFFVVYKRTGMFLGSYVGGETLWRFDWIPGRYGTTCQDAVANLEVAHIFPGDDDIYLFDGTRPVPVGTELRAYFFDRVNQRWLNRHLAQYDRTKRKVYLRYVSNSNTDAGTPNPDRALVWNVQSRKWGVETRSVQAVVEYSAGGGNTDSPPAPLTAGTQVDSAPNIPTDSPFWASGAETPAIFNASNVLQTLSGASSSSDLTTGDYGIDRRSSLLRGVTPRYITAPTTASVTHYYRAKLRDSLSTGSTVTENRGKCDFRKSATWHRLKKAFTGDVELAGFDLEMKDAGKRNA